MTIAVRLRALRAQRKHIEESSEAAAAELLAKRIEQHWHDLGFSNVDSLPR